MNPVTREKCLEMARAAGFNVENGAVNDGIETAADFSEEIESLVRSAVALGLEMAADRSEQMALYAGFDIADEIRKLKDEVQHG